MREMYLYILWAGLYLLCAGLGFIPEPEGALAVMMTALGVGFFAPPGILVFRAIRGKNRVTLQLIRNLSALSLGLTLILLMGNFLSVFGSQWLGNFLHILLGIVSAPMFCARYWLVSLFGWACLLMVCIKALKQKK